MHIHETTTLRLPSKQLISLSLEKINQMLDTSAECTLARGASQFNHCSGSHYERPSPETGKKGVFGHCTWAALLNKPWFLASFAFLKMVTTSSFSISVPEIISLVTDTYLAWCLSW